MNGLYFERGLQEPRPLDCELVELDGQLIPALLSALLARAGRSHWESEAAYHEGWRRLAIQGGEWLMGCKGDIIQEIREVRGPLTPGTGSTLEEYPVGDYPGYTLGDTNRKLIEGGESAASLLAQIRTLLQQQQATEGESLEMLGQIVLLLGV